MHKDQEEKYADQNDDRREELEEEHAHCMPDLAERLKKDHFKKTMEKVKEYSDDDFPTDQWGHTPDTIGEIPPAAQEVLNDLEAKRKEKGSPFMEPFTMNIDNLGEKVMRRTKHHHQPFLHVEIPDLLTDTQMAITDQCSIIKDMLISKNRKYGNSALEPERVFSSADPIEQLNVRIDDKLSRIKSGQADDTEDTELDLIGYLILKRVYRALEGKDV